MTLEAFLGRRWTRTSNDVRSGQSMSGSGCRINVQRGVVVVLWGGTVNARSGLLSRGK